MKKIIIVALALVIVLGCIGLTACDSISGIELTVYTNGVPETYKAGLNKTVTINPGTKNGYYLKGYYTAEVGGEKYFDVNGESLSVWNKSFPTVFYAQWESIKGFESATKSWDNTYTFSPHFGSATSNPGTKFSWEITDEAKNLVMGNLDANLRIRVTGKIKAPVTMKIRLQDTNSSNAEVFESFTLSDETPSGNYNDFIVIAVCPAKIFKDDYIMYLNFVGGFSFSDVSLKDMQISFKVV